MRSPAGRLTGPVNATFRARGGVRDDEISPITFGTLEDHLVEQSRAGKFGGPAMKEIVSAWIDRRLAETGEGWVPLTPPC